MSALIRIPPAEFRRLAVRPPQDLELYGYDSFFLREVFWMRLAAINRLLGRHAIRTTECLDLGTGSGVFLPTLAGRFATVHGADRDVADARNVVAEYRLSNVVLHQRDLLAEPFAPKAFDAIVAADVLEHFPDTAPIASRLFEWLRDDGVLVTSLPSENWIYVLLRRVFDIEKPPDHYFTGAEVEASLARAGFRAVVRRTVPIPVPGTGVFLVTAWRKKA